LFPPRFLFDVLLFGFQALAFDRAVFERFDGVGDLANLIGLVFERNLGVEVAVVQGAHHARHADDRFCHHSGASNRYRDQHDAS
jgi:hypothetical protein